MKLLLLFVTMLFNYVYVYDLCSVPDNTCSERHHLNNCKVKSMNFDSRDCSQVTFAGNEKLKTNLGDISLQVQHDLAPQLFLNISFSDVIWKKAYIRLSDDNNKNQNVCKMYTVEKEARIPLNGDLYDACLWNTAKKLRAKTYLLEYKAENKQDSMYKKILFDMPNSNFYGETVSLSKRLIFSYIDFTSSYEIILNVQTLPKSYNITHYKIEVFREKRYKIVVVGLISDNCPEDRCMKTISSKVYISRKGTPLVIGIVGASFIIPFVLFIFHMWNRRFKRQNGLPDAVEKILILFKPSSDKHNDVVNTLAKTVKHLTGIEVMLDPVNLSKIKPKNADKWCCDNLVLATHIIYITPPDIDDNNCELDCITYNFLKEETKKTVPEKDIIILNLPYSTKDIPPVLANCIQFELMDDFKKFVNIFQPISPDFNYENNINCMELMKKIKLAEIETETLKNKDTPKIIVTDQTEHSDEPREIDVLL